MIVDERIVTFINSLETENSEILEAVEQEALSTYVPIIRKEMQSFLKVLLMIQKPMCILEVGTAVGFSALLMSEAAPEGCRITTIENYEKRIPIARAHRHDAETSFTIDRFGRGAQRALAHVVVHLGVTVSRGPDHSQEVSGMDVAVFPEEAAVVLTAVDDVIPHGAGQLGPRLGNQARKVGKAAEFIPEARQVIPDDGLALVKLPVLDGQEEVPARRGHQ